MTPAQLAQLVELRHALHRIPEVSGQEVKTAAHMRGFLENCAPDQIVDGLGGHGIAAVYDGQSTGPTVLIRCELDGLPIEELSDLPYVSAHAGRGHLCGHDGHMVMVAALALQLAEKRPQTGRVVLLFQPAEETGKGAAAVIADPRFAEIAPDYAFALHNLPGLDLGQLALCVGPANCASRGMRVRLTGRTSHAAAPQDGVSPTGAMARLMPALAALGAGGDMGAEYALTTLTHCWLGEPTFGVAPGVAEIWVTLRTVTDTRMDALVAAAETLVAEVAKDENLAVEISYDDVFDACTNHPEASAVIEAAARAQGRITHLRQAPQSWSEDFGQFGKGAKSAMFWLGSGRDQPQLHNPDFDFPDAAIPVGAGMFQQILSDMLDAPRSGNS